MNTRQILGCVALSGLVMLPLGCGKQAAEQVQGKQEKVAIAGAKATPKQEAVAADKLQNRAGVIYIVNGQEPFSGMAQDFYDNGQMQWEAGIKDGKVTALKRWHENGVLALSCGFTGGTLADITMDAEILAYRSELLNGEFSVYDRNGQITRSSAPAKGFEGTVREFSANRYALALELSSRLNLSLPDEADAFFRAATTGTWDAVGNHFQRLKQQAAAPPEPISALRNELWALIHETFGIWEVWHGWNTDSSLLALFHEPVLASMPKGSIYFGGTDAGRFVITAANAVQKPPRVFCITQNALADGTYTAHLRALYGNEIWIPSEADSANAFTILLNEVDSGKRPPVAGITRENGRVQISGVAGVMEINAILSEMIFEHNKDNHDFFVEESYVVRWMYPHLAPHGLIMKINRDEMPGLRMQTVKDDQDFWSRHVKLLESQPGFAGNTEARKSFSKLRSAIAGLYAYRGMQKEAIQAFSESLALYPLSPEANFRLAEVYMRSGQFDKASVLMQEFAKKEPANDKAAEFIKQIDSIKALNAQVQKIEAELQQQPADAQKVLQLARLYLQAGRTDRFMQVAGGLLQSSEMPSFMLLPLARLYDQARRPQEMAQALTLCLQRIPPDAPAQELLNIAQLFGNNHPAGMHQALSAYLERQPNDWRAWLDFATADVTLGNTDKAKSSLEMAIQCGGNDARQAVQANSQLAPLWQHPD